MTDYRFVWKSILSFGCVCSLIAFATFAMAAETKLAVIGCDDSGLNDLLLTRLSQADGITVVERQRLNDVLDEKAVQGLMKAGAGRDRMTAVAGADFLVLVSGDAKRVQLVVADTRFGVTLENLHISTTGQSLEKTAAAMGDQILAVVTKFAGGIDQVVAVSDFESRDLTYDHSFLQSDYANVLRTAFRRIPRIALVAVDEATAIAAERDVSGIEQHERLVPVFIEGDYRTTRDTNSGETTVRITVRAKDTEKMLINRELPSVPLDQAGNRLLEVFSKDLGELTKSDGDGIDAEGQYKLLTARAAQFSSIGEFRRSAALREAALLLKPNSDAQRIQLVREYTRRNRNPVQFGTWPKGARAIETDPFWTAVVNQTVSDWKRSLQHCEFLIRNRRLCREEATDLTYNAIKSIYSVRMGHSKSKPLAESEVIKKRFLRQSFARIASLDSAAEMGRKGLSGALNTYHFIFEIVRVRNDAHKLNTDDLDLIADLLITDLPDSMWPSYNLNFLLKSAGSSVGREKDRKSYDFNSKQYDAFLDRLTESKRPLVRVYGRYGKFCCRYYGKKEKSAELAEEAAAIVEAANAVGFDRRKYSYFMGQLKDPARRLSRALNPPAPKRKPARKKEKPKLTSRLSFEPIELTFNEAQGGANQQLSSNNPFRSGNRKYGLKSFRPMKDGLDAFWSRGAVLFSHQPGKLTPVLVDKKLFVQDVVCDGRYVWVVGGESGLSVLDTDGNELVRVGKELGLPPFDTSKMVVHPIGPGRLLASGAFGSENRAWIAVISFDGKSAKVEVIHEAIKVRDYKSRNKHYNTDPEMTFSPDAMIEHIIPGDNPRRVIFILHRYNPVLVDPDTLKVWGYPRTAKDKHWFPRKEPPPEAFMSIDGLLYVAGSERNFRKYRLSEETGLFDVVRETPKWHSGNARQGSLARSGDWLYYVGSRNWRRMNLRTGEEELLIEDTRELWQYDRERYWRIYMSSHYGLVAFAGGKLFRVRMKADEGANAGAEPAEKSKVEVAH